MVKIWPKIETGLKFEVKYLTEFRKKRLKFEVKSIQKFRTQVSSISRWWRQGVPMVKRGKPAVFRWSWLPDPSASSPWPVCPSGSTGANILRMSNNISAGQGYILCDLINPLRIFWECIYYTRDAILWHLTHLTSSFLAIPFCRGWPCNHVTNLTHWLTMLSLPFGSGILVTTLSMLELQINGKHVWVWIFCLE